MLKHLVIFTALHGMQTQSSDGKAVRLSVRPSVCLSVCLSNTWLWQNGRKICADSYTV